MPLSAWCPGGRTIAAPFATWPLHEAYHRSVLCEHHIASNIFSDGAYICREQGTWSRQDTKVSGMCSASVYSGVDAEPSLWIAVTASLHGCSAEQRCMLLGD